jgi:hypothetical protein
LALVVVTRRTTAITCVTNPGIRTLVETFPISIAAGCVIPDEAALLLLIKSVVFVFMSEKRGLGEHSEKRGLGDCD